MGCVTRAQIPSTNYRVKPVQFLEDMFQIVVNKSLQKLPPERPTFFFWKADISLRLETLQTCQVVIRYYQIDHPSFHLRVLQPYIFDFIRKAWLLSLSLSTFCLLLGFHSDFGMEAPPPKTGALWPSHPSGRHMTQAFGTVCCWSFGPVYEGWSKKISWKERSNLCFRTVHSCWDGEVDGWRMEDGEDLFLCVARWDRKWCSKTVSRDFHHFFCGIFCW